MMSEEGETRDDLKITENCTPSTHDAVRDLLKSAESNGERVMVVITIYSILLLFVHYIYL